VCQHEKGLVPPTLTDRDLNLLVELARALQQALDQALNPDEAIDGAQGLALDLARALAPALKLDIARTLAQALALVLNRDLDITKSLLDVGKIRERSKSLRQQAQRTGGSIDEREKRLLGCALEILITEPDSLACRRAFLDYEMCLFDLVRPHLSQYRLNQMAPIGLTLRLRLSRINGEVPPYEGILLVRDKTAP
jgi:hypothetical protein